MICQRRRSGLDGNFLSGGKQVFLALPAEYAAGTGGSDAQGFRVQRHAHLAVRQGHNALESRQPAQGATSKAAYRGAVERTPR